MILIVDDEPSALVLLETVLKSDDFVVRKATSGRGALRLLDRDDGEHCALVITDIRMPEMNGLELVAEMRASTRLAGIPVIMCSSASDRATVIESIGRGVCDYIVKPFKADLMLSKVRAIVGDEDHVIEARARTMTRLRIDPVGYAALANTTIRTVDGVADDLVAAVRLRQVAAIRATAERACEPASLFGAKRIMRVAKRTVSAASEADLLHNARILVSEVGEFRASLHRAGIARRL
jgi:DNA-binding NtrC family response regulator